MTWGLRYGVLYNTLQDRNDRIPTGIIPEKPDLNPYDFWLIASFWDLSSCRSIGMGIGPIPFTAIISYIEYYQIDPISSHLLIEVVRHLDTVYMKHANSKKK